MSQADSATLEAVLPAEGGGVCEGRQRRFALALDGAAYERSGALCASLHLTRIDTPPNGAGGPARARADCVLVPARLQTTARRTRAWLEGWGEVLPAALAAAAHTHRVLRDPAALAQPDPHPLADSGLRTWRDFAAALATGPYLRDLAPERFDADALQSWLVGQCPVQGDPSAAHIASLQYVADSVEERGDDLFATFRLVLWDKDGEQFVVSNIKEQHCAVLPARSRDLPAARVYCYLRGWHTALHEVLSSHEIYALMPQDITSPPKHPLALQRPRTPGDFREALLTRSRLGRWARR